MKPCVSGLPMAKRSAFTLIEVMVSVMIITTVVMALYTMNGNSSFIYEKTLKNAQYTGYLSFLVANEKYGFESDTLDLERLLEGFELENELRRTLKEIKLTIRYDEVSTIDLSAFDMQDMPKEMQEDTKQKEQSGAIFEIGRSSLSFDEDVAFITRIRIP